MPLSIAADLPSWMPYAAIALALWTLPWKGLALWRAAKRGERAWFIVFLIVNTAGIIEILYLYSFSRRPATTGTDAK